MDCLLKFVSSTFLFQSYVIYRIFASDQVTYNGTEKALFLDLNSAFMKKRQLLLTLLSSLIFLYSCQKEYSLETGGAVSQGSLLSDVSGDCLPKVVFGTYEAGVAISGATNYIEVEVNVTEIGSYTISSDTINGISFKATGIFTSTGLNTVTLKGTGTPFAAGIQNFLITYGATQCIVAVTTLPAGGGVPAVFTLTGAPGTCMVADLAGTYQVGTATTASNYVVISVNVTTIGTYSITTTASNGLTFSGTGTLGNTGAQTIQLAASGTPLATGATNIPVTAGSSSCSFNVPVIGPAQYTVQCGGFTVNGFFIEGEPVSGTTVTVPVDVTTAGGYSITATVNGITFAGTGTFPIAGIQDVILTASGTPSAAGNFDVNITAGATACSFPIVVDPSTAATGNWQFTVGATTYTGTISDVLFDNSNAPAVLLAFGGPSTLNTTDFFEIDLFDVSGAVQNNEAYNGNDISGTNNASALYYDDGTNLLYQADPSIPTNTLQVVITGHNTTTKTVTGTFSGKVNDTGGILRDVTNGTFSFTYQ